MKNSTFITYDDSEIYYSFWDDLTKYEGESPKGLIQIIHGMSEHSGRYNDFADFLNSQGYIVYATDHRGHGRTAKKIENIGYIQDNDIFHMVKDEQVFTLLIKEKYPEIPCFLLGHSMGSFILQKYLQHMGIVSLLGKAKVQIKGAIIMGSAFRSGEYYIAKWLSLIFLKVFGDKRMQILESILSKKHNIRNPKFILLSNPVQRAGSNVNAINNSKKDPYYATIFSTKFYYELFTFMIDVFKRYNMELIELEIPLFILSGKGDIVGGKSRKIKKLYKEYKNLGSKDLHMKLYGESFHRILSDNDQKYVYEDIKDWLNKRC